MPFGKLLHEHLQLGAFALKWILIAFFVGSTVGSSVAFFLVALDAVTVFRWGHPSLLYLLPFIGVIIGAVYDRYGKSADGGNNLILEQIHEPNGGVPLRMAPLVLGGTLLTHLCGGSAGREGTAVQLGGSLASHLGSWLRLSAGDLRILLMSGVAAGFGAVFGTPLAGAVFALEVVTSGRMNYRALIPCLTASIAGDYTTSLWGVEHSHYAIRSLVATDPTFDNHFQWWLAAKVALAGCAFGLTSLLFSELSHRLHSFLRSRISSPTLRPAIGGLLVIGLVTLLGRSDYLGLGVLPDPATPTAVTITSCFQEGGAETFSWLWKLVFTAITVSSGFKGGEVTPLFFIGAALGHVLGRFLGVPIDLMAGLGFVAVFAGATNTPLACIIMGIELFAPGNGDLMRSGFVVYLSIACCLAYFFSGHSGIYSSQKIGEPLTDSFEHLSDSSLQTYRTRRELFDRADGGNGQD